MISKQVIDNARQTMKHAQQYPSFFIGSQEEGHLFVLKSPLHIACMTPVLHRPRKVRVVVNQFRFWIRVWSKGFHRTYADQIDWTSHENLWEALGELGVTTGKELNVIDIHRITKSHVSIGWIGAGIVFAKVATIGIQIPTGFCSQSFAKGIPQQPIQIIPRLETPEGHVGLWLVADLTPDIFYGLPYKMSEVQQALSDFSGYGLELSGDPIDETAFNPIFENAKHEKS